MKVAVVMGSKSDLPVVKAAIDRLRGFGIAVDAHVYSAHRTPTQAKQYVLDAEKNGIDLIIAAAGKAAHLPGVLAAYTTLPVIGLPIKTSMMGGMDSLLSIVQMPSGIPVATVGVNAGDNAGILAAQILALKYPELTAKLKAFKKEMADKVLADDTNLEY